MRELQAYTASAIRAEAAARLMSIRTLSNESGVPDKTLRRALDCERDLSLDQLDRIARALDVGPAYLLSEAARRQSMATPAERAALAFDADPALSTREKSTHVSDALTFLPPVSSRSDRQRATQRDEPKGIQE